MKKKGCIITALIIAGIFMSVIALFILIIPKYRDDVRRNWKDTALLEIDRWIKDEKWISDEMKAIEAGQTLYETNWLSEHMILMKNREWLIYQNKCSKEDWRINDIFLAKGSDGNWYYTTCHFCIGMFALAMMQDEQPAALNDFISRYHLKVFDDKSDECLKETKAFPDDM